jgi:hypothetical protein
LLAPRLSTHQAHKTKEYPVAFRDDEFDDMRDLEGIAETDETIYVIEVATFSHEENNSEHDWYEWGVEEESVFYMSRTSAENALAAKAKPEIDRYEDYVKHIRAENDRIQAANDEAQETYEAARQAAADANLAITLLPHLTAPIPARLMTPDPLDAFVSARRIRPINPA